MKKFYRILASFYLLIGFTSLQAQSNFLYDQEQKPCLQILDNQAVQIISTQEIVGYIFLDTQENIQKLYSPEGTEIGFFEGGLLLDKHKKIIATQAGIWEQNIGQVNDKGIKTILLTLDYFEWVAWQEIF